MTASSDARFHRKMMDKVIRKIGYPALLKKCSDKKCKVHKMSSDKKQVLEELRKNDWTYTRQTASHLIFHHPIRKGIITVPVDLNHKGLAKKILCDIRNGSKYEKRELKGAHPMPQTKKGAIMETQPQPAAPKAPSIPPELKAKILADMSGKLHDDKERWKSFPKFPDYEISSLGNVRRTYRAQASGVKTKLEHPIPVTVITLDRGGKSGAGRRAVSFYDGKKSTVVSLIKALADAFLPAAPGMFAMPKNGNYLDCRADNIKWATRAEIMIAGRGAPKEKAPKEAKVAARGKMGPAAMEFPEEKVLEAATAFEEGMAISRVSKMLGCSDPTTRKQLARFLGEESFEKLAEMTPAARRKAVAEKKAGSAYVPQPAVEIPKPVITAKTPEAAAKYGLPMSTASIRLADIHDVSATIRGGVARVTITLDASSPTFLLLCSWAPKK